MENSIKFNYGVVSDVMNSNTIYIDGAFKGPFIDNDRRSYSFDHHGECIRAFTLSSCQQSHLALELGFDPTGCDIVCNDIDADTVISVWVLLHPDTIKDPVVIDLVNKIGYVDNHGPAIPGHNIHPLHFEITPRYGTKQSIELLEEYLEKVTLWYTAGAVPEPRVDRPAPAFGLLDGKLIDLDLVKDFKDVYASGCTVGIVCVPGPEATTAYTVGKQSDFVQYSIQNFIARCNEIEPGWGGGTTIGGAPRNTDGTRSKLDRKVVEQLLLNA